MYIRTRKHSSIRWASRRAIFDLLPFQCQPTSKNSTQVLSDFNAISSGTTYGQVTNFLRSDFSGEGQELELLNDNNFNDNPPFLQNISDPTLQAWSKTVHRYWTQLIKGTNESRLCGALNGCESTLIPLNHTFVVPGTFLRD